ncbi:GW dipeptide domain-containing protein [Kurthia huakuii]|uniref:GW dipeptide domain-containing protein n=1 Tax=Kurthia huakuii TaxID=1421019 RepID=UPI000495BFFF|nr:GW dipeptide domain-containing protein [Kurthia huakuii]MBM7698826.1 hypothetical protein [Kurthia huakuii]
MTQTWKMLAAMGIATTIMTSPVAMNGQNVQVAQAATTTSITYMGQIDDPKTAIYDGPGGEKFDTVDTLYSKNSFYIHKKATVNGVTYYRISRNENPTYGAIGWVKASNIHVKKMTEQKNVSKAYPMNGKGNAYSRPDGGERNIWHSLKDYKNRQFYPQRTVKVGSATWYYGKVGERNAWISTASLTENVDTAGGVTTPAKKVSYMGMLHSKKNVIYKTAGGAKLQTAGELYTENQFYVHQKKIVDGVTYYRISRHEGAAGEFVGWVKAAAIDLVSLKTHANVTESFKLTGTGNAYSRPAGGKRNMWHSLASYKNDHFRAQQTVEVDGTLWYYGKVGERNVWIAASSVTDSIKQAGNPTSKTTAVSYVGQVKSTKTPLYRVAGKTSTKFLAGASYTNETYYIYKKIVVNGTTYYELRRSQSGDIIGWVKDKSVSKQSLKFVTNTTSSFLIDGTGKGYTRPNGKTRNTLYPTMKPFAGDTFKPTSTALISKELWYVGQIGSKTGWLKATQLTIK